MSSFYAQVCRKGHVKIDYKRARPEQKCRECGEEVLDTCPSCGALIKKWYYYGSVPVGPKKSDFQREDCCTHCGAAFPWAKKE